MHYTYTTQRQLRAAFWKQFPHLSRKKITNYSGNGKMYRTDTRCAWCDWIDMLSKSDQISEVLANRATLD